MGRPQPALLGNYTSIVQLLDEKISQCAVVPLHDVCSSTKRPEDISDVAEESLALLCHILFVHHSSFSELFHVLRQGSAGIDMKLCRMVGMLSPGVVRSSDPKGYATSETPGKDINQSGEVVSSAVIGTEEQTWLVVGHAPSIYLHQVS